MPTYSWVSPTGHLDPSLTWNNPTRAYDGNWNNFTDNSVYSEGWTAFLTLTLPGNIWIDRIRFKYLTELYPAESKKIDIDVYNAETGLWEDVIEADYDGGLQHTITFPPIHTDRVRVRLPYDCGGWRYLYELDVEQVIPDPYTPPPTPPAPPEAYHTITKEQKGEPPFQTTRLRALHRSTEIKPWVV